jgi:hypothetical protein
MIGKDQSSRSSVLATQNIRTTQTMDTQPSREWLLADVERLQHHLDEFKANLDRFPFLMNNSTNSMSNVQMPPSKPDGDSLQPGRDGYAGPTSFAWSMNTADSKLSSLTKSLGDSVDYVPSPSDQELTEPDPSASAIQDTLAQAQELEKLSVEDVGECLDTFENIFGVLHSLHHLSRIRLQASSLLRIVKRSLSSQQLKAGRCGLLEVFKIVLAVALAAVAGGPTALSNALYQSIAPMLGAASVARTISHDFRSLLLLVVRRCRNAFKVVAVWPN